MHNSNKPRDWILAKGYGFLYFAKNIDKRNGKTKVKT